MAPDHIVVGAGPAGCVAAALLASAGRRVVVYDAVSRPRPKPCGEFLAPQGAALITALGWSTLLDQAWPLQGLRLVVGKWHSDHAFDAESRGYGLQRQRFDGGLREMLVAAGIDIQQRRVTAATPCSGSGWQVDFADGGNATCSSLVVADGRHSRLRSALGLSRPNTPQRRAMVWEVAGLPHRSWAEMHSTPWGQIGIAPNGPAHANVNLLLAGHRPLPGKHDTLLHRLLEAAGYPPRALIGLTTERCFQANHLLAQSSRRSIPGVVLAGDAAAASDPFAGAGISHALLSGALAARALIDPVTDYESEWARLIGRPGLAVAALGPLLRRPRLGHALFRHGWPLRALVQHQMRSNHRPSKRSAAAIPRATTSGMPTPS